MVVFPSNTRRLEGWVLLERTLKDEYPVQSFDKEKATAEELKQQQPASLLSKLGDHAIGFGGALHIFNFLYSQITVEFVSLQKVLLTMFDNFEWQHVFPANLTISQGACRLFEPENFAPIGNTGKAGIGQVVYRIDLLYRNPLENELRELKERAEEIFSIVSSAGPIQTHLAAANTELKHLEAELDISRASIGDENDIKAVNVSLQEIKKALEQPR